MENSEVRRRLPEMSNECWENVLSILNPKCECGDVLHYVTDGHYNFTNEDYELYVCHGCGKWKTIITKEDNDGGV